ncbi:DNA-directed RNA polymerase III subunit rpc3 [Lachnellula suecica]|uniref:DNA-directed RNA polymerase III subunit RPC3 n=1 Tax=Lachnellula suecica TaxID=602035 RepID=A0A8T9BVT0_9HELO|nr:DNA-directed RNA polymerase III subunit rpc3 [Lachnellula suecica]
MSRSQYAVELCALLVDETYGELTSRIFTTLLRKGRLPIATISKHTRLTPRALRHGLAVLIQQNLVYHHTVPKGLTHYEANDDAAYNLTRSGKIMEIVESRYGPRARDVVQNLFLHGHIKVSDLADAYKSPQQPAVNGKANGHPAVNGVNGHANANVVSEVQLDVILVELLELGLIEPVVERMFRSPADTRLEVENRILRDEYNGEVKGKTKELLQGKSKEKLEEMEAENREWKSKVLKRPLNGVLANGVNGSSKRRRLSHSGASINGDHAYEDDGTRLDPNLVIRINHEKCAVLLRNFQLVEAVKDRIGETTSQVYAELLKRLEKKITKCQTPKTEDDDQDRPSVMTKDIAAWLPKSVNVALGIGKTAVDAPRAGNIGEMTGSPPFNRKRKADDLEAKADRNGSDDEDRPVVNGNGTTHDEEDDPFLDDTAVKPTKRQKVTFVDNVQRPEGFHTKDDRILQVKDHLFLLEHDKYGFVTKAGMNGHGEWSVDFENIIKHLREAEIDKLVLEMFGPTGHRLVRMLRKMGKLDEKVLKDTALMKQKDVRTKLAELQLSGWVDIQEVPKDGTRGANNARVIFLWFFDNERCSTLVLDHTYKAMSRLLERLGVERLRAKSVLELTQRRDMRDKPPDEYLTQTQMNELNAFRDREEMLLGQLNRLDEIVGIFRDY